MNALANRKILMVIASNNFRDEEFQIPKKLFAEQGAQVTVASSKLRVSTGMRGMKVMPDVLLNKVKAEDYNAVVFVGGGGAAEYWDDPISLAIAQRSYNNQRIVAAICIAPIILANADLLVDKKATVFSTEVSQLEAKGAIYTGQDVERDGCIITGSGPQAAARFAQTVIQALQE